MLLLLFFCLFNLKATHKTRMWEQWHVLFYFFIRWIVLIVVVGSGVNDDDSNDNEDNNNSINYIQYTF